MSNKKKAVRTVQGEEIISWDPSLGGEEGEVWVHVTS